MIPKLGNLKSLSDAELIEKVKQLAALEDKYRNDNRIEFLDKAPNRGLNPLQMELYGALLDPQYKVLGICGANRIGKTFFGGIIAVSCVVGKFLWNGVKFPIFHNMPRKVRYVGQDWEKHIKAVVLPELEKWWPKNRSVKKKKNNQGIDAFWTDEKTGSTIEIMSNLQDSDLHEGWSGDLIIYDEPPKRDIRVANARGLIDRQGRELFCMTLLKEAWVDREVIKARLPNGEPDPTVYFVNGDIYTNVGYGITKEGVEQFEKTLTDDEKSARILGVPSYMSGLVYPTFSRKKHLKKRFKIPLDWIVDIAIDVHPRERQAILFMATSPRNERYVFHEIWDHGDGTWIGEQIVRVIKGNSLRIGHIIVDPLSKGDKNNPNTTFDKIDTVLYRYGYVLDTATKDKQSGIIEVKNHLIGPNKEPSLFFFDDLIRTTWEIEGYMYDEESQKPMDKDDHMMENLYRLCMLNTQWNEMNVGDEDLENPAKTANKFTGY